MEQQRQLLVKEYQEGLAVTELAKIYGISRKTVYKWLERHDEHGVAGLADLSRRPLESPTRVSDTSSFGGFAGAVITYTSLKVPGNLVFFSSTGSNSVIQIDPQLLGVLNGVIS